jgi:small-conductance mechanosensitive channel
MIDELSKKIGVTPERLLGNPLSDWLAAAIVALLVWTILWAVRKFVTVHYESHVKDKSPRPIWLTAYLISNTTRFFFIGVTLYAAQEILTLPAKTQRIVDNTVMLLLLLQAGIWAGRAVRFYLEMKRRERGADRVFAGSLDIINFVARMLIWAFLTLVALENLGVNITALLAGLGVGGVAVALALQNILGDLFASLSIALDKPFMVGDLLTIDTFTGNVEHIGIKTTRLRSESGEQIILSNADILKSRVRNFGRLRERRMLATVRVSYETPAEKVKKIPQLLRNIVGEYPQARFERCHLMSLGDCCLQFELSYFVQEPNVNSPLDLQQSVNFRIIDEIKRLGIEFAYPTQLVYMNGQRAAADK